MARDVFFGFETALRIARCLELDTLPSVGRRLRIPAQPPTKRDVLSAMACIDLAGGAPAIERPPLHVVVGSKVRPAPNGLVRPHVCSIELPGGSFFRLADHVYVATPNLALVQMAPQHKCLPQLLELLWEAAGTYQTFRTAPSDAYNVKPLTTARALRSYVRHCGKLRGVRAIEQALPYLADGSASARETKLALTLGLPQCHGGYGLGIPSMNFTIRADAFGSRSSGKRTFRGDLCWPQAKVDVEYQSFESHHGELKRLSDSRRANAITGLGWTVIGVTNDELDSYAATETIANAVRKAIGKRDQCRIANYHARKLRLRRQLMLQTGYE